MPVLTISHETAYRYRQPVSLGEHRIMVRPHESYDQRLIAAELDIDPAPAELRWLHDVFGNSVALASFAGHTRTLRIASRVRLEHLPITADAIHVEPHARRVPFAYATDDLPDLLRSMERQHRDPDRRVDEWARGFLDGDGADTLALLTAITSAIRRDFTYVPRHEHGTQTPVETLNKRQGTCRDYAVLMMDAARALGLAARFVSGYVYAPSAGEGRVGGGSTHAWVHIFLPGSGWTEFDPTNGIVGNRGLIRVGVARDPFQVVPLSGTWFGHPGSADGMTVAVDITMDAASPTEAPPVAASA